MFHVQPPAQFWSQFLGVCRSQGCFKLKDVALFAPSARRRPLVPCSAALSAAQEVVFVTACGE